MASGMRRHFLVVGAAILGCLATLVGTAPAFASPLDATGAGHVWYVASGTQSPDRAIQGMVFLPGTITIDVGDTIVWYANSAEPHTVTFNPTPGEQFNPFAPAVGNGGDFGGAGYFSSGSLANVSQATAGFPTEEAFRLTFTAPGTYIYYCMVHPGMTGTVVVHPFDTPYPRTQQQYNAADQLEQARILAQGYQRMAQDEASSTNHFVVAGDMVGAADVMRFVRQIVVIHTGQAVTFDNMSMEPHTITFGTEIGNPVNPWGAPGLPSTGPIFGGHYYTTLTSPDALLNSGWIFTGVELTITFQRPGVYHYHCALHDYMGMIGTVIVIGDGGNGDA